MVGPAVCRAVHAPVPALCAGLLLHGLHLDGVFVAIGLGMSAGLTALIVGAKPLLAGLAAPLLFGEQLGRLEVAGIALVALGGAGDVAPPCENAGRAASALSAGDDRSTCAPLYRRDGRYRAHLGRCGPRWTACSSPNVCGRALPRQWATARASPALDNPFTYDTHDWPSLPPRRLDPVLLIAAPLFLLLGAAAAAVAPTLEILVVLLLLTLTVFLFVFEVVEVDVASIGILVLIGLISAFSDYLGLAAPLVQEGELFAGFASNAVVSIIAVMIIGAGLD